MFVNLSTLSSRHTLNHILLFSNRCWDVEDLALISYQGFASVPYWKGLSQKGFRIARQGGKQDHVWNWQGSWFPQRFLGALVPAKRFLGALVPANLPAKVPCELRRPFGRVTFPLACVSATLFEWNHIAPLILRIFAVCILAKGLMVHGQWFMVHGLGPGNKPVYNREGSQDPEWPQSHLEKSSNFTQSPGQQTSWSQSHQKSWKLDPGIMTHWEIQFLRKLIFQS